MTGTRSSVAPRPWLTPGILPVLFLSLLILGCGEPTGVDSPTRDRLRSDARMAALVNEALSESPDEARLGALMTSLYSDYGMFDPGPFEPCPFVAKGLNPAVGGNRCDWENIYIDALYCGLGAGGMAVGAKTPSIWGKGLVYVGMSSICIARSIQSRCEGGWASMGGGSW